MSSLIKHTLSVAYQARTEFFSTMRLFVVSAFIVTILWGVTATASFAEQSSSEERTDAAIGHYAKSRALLVEALEEFETARKLARPDLLIDPEEWRISVISRAEELNRILDPQPRITRSGTRFQANNRLVRRISKRDVKDLPKDANVYGERYTVTESKHATTGKNLKGTKDITGNKDLNDTKIETQGQIKNHKSLKSILSSKTDSENTTKNETPEIDKGEQSNGTVSLPDDVKDSNKQKSPNITIAKSPSKLNKESQKTENQSTKHTNVEKDPAKAIGNKATVADGEKSKPQGNEAGVIEDMKKEDPSVADMVEKVIEGRVKKLKEEQAKEASKPKPSDKTVDGLFNQYSDQ